MTTHGPETIPVTFRHELRHTTAQAHHSLDTLLSELDLRQAPHRRLFDAIQLAGFRRIGAACGWQAGEATEVLARTVEALSRGAAAPEVDAQPAPDAPMEPDAVAYLTLGSQLGLSVLRRDVPEAERHGILALEPELAAWKTFAQRLSEAAPDATRRARILADAARAFAIFQEEAERLLRPKSTQAPVS